MVSVAQTDVKARYDLPDGDARAEDTHGFATAGLRRGDPLDKPTTPQLA